MPAFLFIKKEHYMRLDKYLSENANLTRKTAKHALHRSDVTVDGVVVKKGDVKIKEQEVRLNGVLITVKGPTYIMLNKPVDYVCSTVDDDGLAVLHLIDEDLHRGLHIAGRLDKDTTGLVLLTDDGQWSHRITSPKSQCNKVYMVEVMEVLEPSLVGVFKEGLELNNESDLTRPATLEILSDNKARLTICEGKYHQVKRMFAAVDNHVTALHRSQIGPLVLGDDLALGQWRKLTNEEINALA